MTLTSRSFAGLTALTAIVAAGLYVRPAHAADAGTPAEKQTKLIAILRSDAPPQEKAITCKRLAIYGGKEAVPALAPLLSDRELASWARIALEVIPDPAADDALREAAGKLDGLLLVGVVNSIGVRRDAKAVGVLVPKLNDPNAEVAAAAAEALGKIGGEPAAKALVAALAAAPTAVRSEIAYGCILCAERFMADGRNPAAVQLYETVRQADVPKQRILEATRGAILARGSAGLPLLVQQLKSEDKDVYGLALRTAREIPGPQVTAILSAEFARTTPQRQASLLLAMADRGDVAALSTIRDAARSGPKPVRLAAIGALERLDNNGSSAPVLLDIVTGEDADLSKTARSALGRLPGKQVDTELLARLPQASGKTRQTLIDLAGQRRVSDAVPLVMASTADSDAGIRRAAVTAIGVLGDEKQAAKLAALLQESSSAEDRGEIEKALMAIGGRRGSACLEIFLPLAQNSDSGLRKTGLHTLSSVGGSKALDAVKAALNDADSSVQDEAVRTLSAWPSNWPDDDGVAEPLLTLARSGKKTSHQVLGVRGYLEYVQRDKKLSDDDKVARIKETLPLIKRPEEKRLAISALGTVPTIGALNLLVAFTADDAVVEEACAAIVTSAGNDELKGATKEVRQKALQTVVEKSGVDRTKRKAQEVLKRVR